VSTTRHFNVVSTTRHFNVVSTTRHFNKPLFIISFHVLLILNALVGSFYLLQIIQDISHVVWSLLPPLWHDVINNILVSAHDNELGNKTSLNKFLLRHLLKSRSCLSIRNIMQAVQQVLSEICKCCNSPPPISLYAMKLRSSLRP